MDTASLQFVLFGLAAAGISNLGRSHVWRSFVLILFSVVFLGLLAPQPLVLLPMAGFLLLGYVGLVLVRLGGSRFMVVGIVATVFVYMWLKKYTFLPGAALLHSPYFTLGLSYIFFRVLHLLIESGDAGESRRVGFGAYLLYTLNFTTFVSGPIQRYDEFARDQFVREPIALNGGIIFIQLERIVRGFFKISVLAILLQALHENALAQMTQPLPASPKLYAAFALAVSYPLFLYANFSGYIDIVIGVARLMRVRLPENFERPFSADSVIEFWNRWHITLSTWLKTYVYNPLLITLMRRMPSPMLEPFLGVLCVFITFFLVGIWHGRTSEFVVFGLLTGGGMAINKLWQVGLTRVIGRRGYKAISKNAFYTVFSRGLTFSWFSFTLFWFQAEWKEIDTIFKGMGRLEWLNLWLAVWLCASVVLAGWETLRAGLLSIETSSGPVLISRYARVVYGSALSLVIIFVTVLFNQPIPDIVYKGF